ncbi:DOMON-like domain-containing protein [Sphingobium nicotianae]|uniref:DOMON-like domain-containing protein n=1 Tax=Sphingobium nicotianae TaxID=2782607 RepID=A0A9X1DD45_9SPHN|nr:DOMON-like domain-containing protein [Sphingobium nicotianae]MBT2187704.1 DOMON-like domain-containing protein [Sphingobium nicotianae]
MSRVLATTVLQCHLATPCVSLAAVGAQISQSEDMSWEVAFAAVGKPREIVIPPAAPRVHTDDLWKTTCFELFIGRGGDSYAELNLSPSGAFAVYNFDHYRTGMRRIDLPAPDLALDIGRERITLTARFPEDSLPWDYDGRIGISAVIEEKSGAKSYWALAHPPGKPDFHHHDCFALALPPLGSA